MCLTEYFSRKFSKVKFSVLILDKAFLPRCLVTKLVEQINSRINQRGLQGYGEIRTNISKFGMKSIGFGVAKMNEDNIDV